MKGYKAFKSNLTCLDYQFTTTQTHTFDGEPILCEQGFHFCTDLQDVVKYYHKSDMRVFEIEANGIVTDAENNCSKRACSEIRLVKEISLNKVMLSITKSEPAFYWAMYIGNQDIMINYIIEFEWANKWAREIGNQDIMISIVTESIWADSGWAYWWAIDIGNQDIMVDKVTDSGWAYKWAKNIGNVDIMKSRVTEPYWIERWNNWFPVDKII